jgi:replicative DNA helicase
MAMKRGSAERDLIAADRIVAARQELAGLPLAIDDAGGQTAAQISAKARAYRRKHGLGLILIDHLNLMRADDVDAKHGGTWAVERASATVLQLAKECECPVLLLAQLNRSVETREDKRPGLSDLRQAGAIEQDAYAVGFVYRPEYYLGGEPEPKVGDSPVRAATLRQDWLGQKALLAGRAELIWAKVRDGEPGVDRLTFDGPTATFSEADDGR